MNTPSSERFDLVPAHLAIRAMRDNGYRNTAYAVAELIDNSVQAGATSVELLCLEDEEVVRQRRRKRIKGIAVLDNGSGMDASVLRMALQFGNGTHLDDRDGIGRFGMGLPSASISQCSRVDVWSWRGDPAKASYTFIDLDNVVSGAISQVPEPIPQALPEEWIRLSNGVGESGTLVVWSQLDRCLWRTGKSVISNSEFLIARMYRRFLARGEITIRMASYLRGRDEPVIDESAQPNDPGYLLSPSSTPSPYDSQRMFHTDGSEWEVERVIEFAGEEHKVLIRFSLAREEARNPHNAGALPYGKHAARNIGISLIRAGRELDMDQALVQSYNARERWWGVEVDFPPSIDELFGVTNNKQSARHFTEIAERLETFKAGQENWADYKQLLEDDEDPSAPLVNLIDFIDKRIRLMRKVIEVQGRGAASRRRRHDPSSAEAIATDATRQRQGKGHSGHSDEDEERPDREREDALAGELEQAGLAPEDAKELAGKTISSGIKYTFAEADLEGMSFFTVKPVAGEIVIKININHPAYKNLDQILATVDEEETTVEVMGDRLHRASRGLRLLLLAWARLEDEQASDTLRAEMQEVRNSWGAMAYRFMQEE